MTRPAVLALALVVGVAGCGDPPPSGPTAAPLTVAELKALPVGEKYTAETLERLKAGDPKLQTAEGWEAFSKTTLAAARKTDFPGGRPRP